MFNRSHLFPILMIVSLASCNFPFQTTVSPSTPTIESIDTIPTLGSSKTPTLTATVPLSTATSTATPMPTSGPIAHLSPGEELAISQIDMIDPDTGWAIGGAMEGLLQDHVLQTSNGGSTWKDVTPPEKTVVQPATERIAVGGFWDADTALITFYSADLLPPPAAPVVWKTSDGGTTWIPSAPLDLSGWTGEYRVSDVFFINLQTAWILAHKGNDPKADRIALYQTVNGGATWDRMIDPAVNSDVQDCEKTGILFTGPWNGWMTGDCLGEQPGVFLHQTFDGGKNWIEAKLPSPATPPGMLTTSDFSCHIYPPAFFAQQTALMLPVECKSKTTPKIGAYLYSSNLNGSDWHTMVYPGGSMVIRSPGDGRVFRGDVESGLILGKEAFIFNGISEEWEEISPIDWTGQFDFIDWNKGWAAARRGETPLLMYTKDGGRSWKALTPTIAAN